MGSSPLPVPKPKAAHRRCAALFIVRPKRRTHDKALSKDPLFFALACICVYVCTFSASESVSARWARRICSPSPRALCSVSYWAAGSGVRAWRNFSDCAASAAQRDSISVFSPDGAGRLQPVARGTMEFPPVDTFIYILSMLLAGFLEEVLFRGLLFTALRPRGLKRAALISSLTFGLGHIVNLLNGAALAHPAPAVLCLRHRAAVHRALPEEREPSARHTDSQSAQCFECLFHGRRGHFPNHFRRSPHADGVALHPVAGQKSIKKSCPRAALFLFRFRLCRRSILFIAALQIGQ